MYDARGGYTIIEVFIVLAISGVLLFSAVALFSGKQAQAQFNQAMQDLDSKIKSYINDVGVGTFPASENYTCSLSTDGNDRPELAGPFVTTKVVGSNQDCIFLGKAIQVYPDPSSPNNRTITIHTVLGNRTYDSGGARVPVTNFDASLNPEPVIQLQQTYNIAYSAARVVKSWANEDYLLPPTQSYDMAGFYNSLQASTVSTEQGSQSLVMRAYRIVGNGQTAQTCIREENMSCQPLPDASTPLTKWTMCLASDNDKEWATLALIPTPAGVQTELTFKPDPDICPN